MSDRKFDRHPNHLSVLAAVATYYVARDETFAFAFRHYGKVPLTDKQARALVSFENHHAVMRLMVGNQNRLTHLVDTQHEFIWGGGRAAKYGALCGEARWAYEALLPTEGNVRRVLVVMQRHLLTFGPHVVMSRDAGVFLVKQHFGVTLGEKTVERALKRIVELGFFELLSKGRSWGDSSGPTSSAVFGFVIPAQAPSDTPFGSLLLNGPSPCPSGYRGGGIQGVDQAEKPKKKRRTAWIELPETIEAMTKAEIAEFEAWRAGVNSERRHGLDKWKGAGPAETRRAIKHLGLEWVEVPSSDSEGRSLPAETRRAIKPSAFVNVSTFGSTTVTISVGEIPTQVSEPFFVHPKFGEMCEEEYRLWWSGEQLKKVGFGKSRATRFETGETRADSRESQRNWANTG